MGSESGRGRRKRGSVRRGCSQWVQISGKRGQWEEGAGSWVSSSGRGQWEGPVEGTSRQWGFGRGEELVGGGGQWEEGASSEEGWPVRGWVNGRRVGQRESGTAVAGEWGSEWRVVRWEEGEAMGHVVILMFHPPN